MRIDSILTHIIHSWSGIDSFAWKWLKRADSWFLRVYFKAVCSITKAIARGLNSTVHLPRLMDFLPQNGWLRTAMAMGPILRAGRGSNDLLNCVNNSAIWKCVSRCQSNVSKAPFNSSPADRRELEESSGQVSEGGRILQGDLTECRRGNGGKLSNSWPDGLTWLCLVFLHFLCYILSSRSEEHNF